MLFDGWVAFLLLTVRCLGFYTVGPLFTQIKIPAQIQVLMAVSTSVALFPTVDQTVWGPDVPLLEFVLLIAREVLFGGFLGMVASASFLAVRFGGQLIGIQMGFSLAQVFDPVARQEVPLIGRLQETLSVLLFLLLDGHHILLRGLGFSIQMIAPGGFPDAGLLFDVVLSVGGSVFILALQVGAPVLAGLFLTDAALGFVARAVPQMNIFLIGIPIKIAAGFVFLVVITPLFGSLIRNHTLRLESQFLAVLAGM